LNVILNSSVVMSIGSCGSPFPSPRQCSLLLLFVIYLFIFGGGKEEQGVTIYHGVKDSLRK
jgi:hypothetical protein